MNIISIVTALVAVAICITAVLALAFNLKSLPATKQTTHWLFIAMLIASLYTIYTLDPKGLFVAVSALAIYLVRLSAYFNLKSFEVSHKCNKNSQCIKP